MTRRKKKGRGQKPRARRAAKRKNQIGGMLPGLILAIVKAKKQKKKVGKAMKNYMTGAVGRRIAVAKTVAGKKIPTPGNTGMSAGDFFKSALLGIG